MRKGLLLGMAAVAVLASAHDVVKGLTGTKNLFNEDILQRVKDGRIVKIGKEGNCWHRGPINLTRISHKLLMIIHGHSW